MKAELVQLASLLQRSVAAPQLLAERLSDRLNETGGEVRVTSPLGWLLSRGLVQRPACSDVRCDDGIRLDTSGDCPTCGNIIHLRRAQRARIAVEVEAALPNADDAARTVVLEERLRQRAALEAEDFMWRCQQAEAEQARQEAARAESQARAERERAATQAGEEARQELPCADCGMERSAGLCEACGYSRQTEALMTETSLVMASWAADIDDPADIAAVTAQVRADLERIVTDARQRLLDLMDPASTPDDPRDAASGLAFTAKHAVEQAAAEYRSNALAMLGRSPKAETEARKAYDTEKGRRQHQWYPGGPIARAAANQAAGVTQKRTAQHLLATRMEQLRSMHGGRTDAATPDTFAAPALRDRWADRLAPLAARPISDDLAGTAIA